MSRSDYSCKGCHKSLGYRHHGGTLHGAAGVTVSCDIRTGAQPQALFICPRCGMTRAFTDGLVVIGDHADPDAESMPPDTEPPRPN